MSILLNAINAGNILLWGFWPYAHAKENMSTFYLLSYYLPHFTAEVLHVSPVWLRGHVELGGGEVRGDGVGDHPVPVNIHIHNTACDPQGQHQHLPDVAPCSECWGNNQVARLTRM